jgi:predicted transcriptional regulator
MRLISLVCSAQVSGTARKRSRLGHADRRGRQAVDGSRVSDPSSIENVTFFTGERTIVTELMKSSSGDEHRWRFVTNHADVLQCIAADPSSRIRDVAASVGITERTAAQILKDLERAGYVTKTRNGRRNRYELHERLPLRHPRHRHRTVGELIEFLRDPGRDDR